MNSSAYRRWYFNHYIDQEPCIEEPFFVAGSRFWHKSIQLRLSRNTLISHNLKMLGPFCKKHFTISEFYPLHDDPSTFIYSQWQRDKTKPALIYLAYRILIALLFFITWLISIIKDDSGGRWLIFLTNWGYTICTSQALLALGMVSASVLAPYLKSMPSLKEKTLKIYPVYWILHIIAVPLSFGITFMYWVVIYDARYMTLDAMNYFVHAFNSVLMLTDLCVVSHPVRILHFLYPAILGFVYTIFSIIYYLAGGTDRDGCEYIYKILNWKKVLPTALTCVGVTFFLVCLHIIVFLLYKTRCTIYEKCYVKKQDSSGPAETKMQAAYVNEAMSNDAV